MATNSPESSIHSKSPRSPRQLPQLPRIPISGQRSPSQLSVTKTPSTPLVFEFPAEYYPETPNTNFDFDTFARNMDTEQQRGSSRSPSYYSINKNQKSPNSSDTTLHSSGRKSPIFKFCDKNLISSSSNNTIISANRTATTSNFVPKSPNMVDRRRNSSFGLGGPKSPISPTIVTPTSSSSHDSPKHTDSELRCKDGSFGTQDENVDRNCSMNEKTRASKMGGYLNRSQGCLNEATRCCEGTSVDTTGNDKKEKNMARRSTSDLTEIGDAETEVTLLSSPRRRGSMKGGLAYLASRRGSRDSQCSNVSNISNEDVGPLNFNAHPRVRQRRTSNFLELPVPDHIRPRVHSLPEKAYNPRAGDDLYRLRAFSITHKGVVNRGDSIISRRSRSNTSVNSSRNSNISGERSPFEGSCCSGQGGAESTESEIEEIPKYRVVLLGDSGVGKTALVSQFMTSEYMNTYDASLDDEFGEKTVSILLDEEESEMIFIDHPHIEMSVENSLSTYEPHACIVVYSIVSRTSFQMAEEILNYLWREHYTQERSVIVVGNKSDLARSRTILSNEGKQLATSRECKFIETSSGIKHNVDELLVGVLKQIRLRESREKKLRRQCSKGKMSKLHASKTAHSLNLAREILNKMCLKDSKSKSCENLHVL
ncbi:uncharacterized protein LOC122628639 [Vespula pensylvanica]|uniref:uncharacterized protein LOC122628639 n=1 Tax=Vespula pensylvanica TaxID=30213 RepID=UPI001CB9FDF0|nr:uncharacterized protein LOC122628639 [Vespula pensylvanica]XP_043667037.1 uncharacterized protein LOC122628639 [Vespula pensylvanica]XP_043667038.1 uncharacterized protein LOC122628639 [Vespula pensylvanica]